MMKCKWLGAVVPLALVVASCSDLPTDTGHGAAVPVPAGLNFYLAPAGDVVVYGTGDNEAGGEIWAVNLTKGSTHLMWNVTDPNTVDNNSPNAVAFDAVNGRMYFTVNTSVVAPLRGTADDLYFFNVTPPYVAPVKAGTIARTAYSGDFWGGSYYYIPNRTHDLMKVGIDGAGYLTGEVVQCEAFRAGLTDAAELFFGDIAIRDNIVYGSVAVGGDPAGSGPRKFFKLNLTGCAYEEFTRDLQLQLAWGGDGKLYGHHTATGVFYVVNQTDGTLSAGPTYAGPVIKLSDVAPAAFTVKPEGAVLLIIDEDGIDNGLHVNKNGGLTGLITPSGPQFWTGKEVNDDIAAYGLRNVLRYFATQANYGRSITVRTGQTGDEGWFAPNCIPQKWLNSAQSKTNNTCLDGANRDLAVNNYFFSGKTPFVGAPSSWNLPQDRLDKVPHVLPLRARGLVSLEGKDVCALVYDSDISINYDHGTPLGINGNLQGATLGIAAFRVNKVITLNNFSSSTLPQVNITILDASVACKNFQLFNAPVPNSSSEPNDRVVENLAGLGSKLYRSFKVWSTKELFY
jgi:hypothetical protein